MQSQTALLNNHVEPACQRKTSIFDTYIKVHLVNIVWQQHHLAPLMPGWKSCLLPEETEIQRARWLLNYIWPLLCEQLFTAPAQHHWPSPPNPPQHLPSSPQSRSKRWAPSLASPLSALWLRRGFQSNLSLRLSSASCSCGWNEPCKCAAAPPPPILIWVPTVSFHSSG